MADIRSRRINAQDAHCGNEELDAIVDEIYQLIKKRQEDKNVTLRELLFYLNEKFPKRERVFIPPNYRDMQIPKGLEEKPKSFEILRYIIKRDLEDSRIPSQEEIAVKFKMAGHGSVQYHLEILEKLKYIKKLYSKSKRQPARSLTVNYARLQPYFRE